MVWNNLRANAVSTKDLNLTIGAFDAYVRCRSWLNVFSILLQFFAKNFATLYNWELVVKYLGQQIFDIFSPGRLFKIIFFIKLKGKKKNANFSWYCTVSFTIGAIFKAA
jgi:hypothetical protein